MSSAGSRSTALRGGIAGALAGSAIAVAVVLIVDLLVSGDQNDLLWLPVSIAGGIVGGGVIGMLFSQVVIGGRERTLAGLDGRDGGVPARAARQRER
jgi:hypothetical protein